MVMNAIDRPTDIGLERRPSGGFPVLFAVVSTHISDFVAETQGAGA
jgi:hypothetical protein